jgi:hypothetical protein
MIRIRLRVKGSHARMWQKTQNTEGRKNLINLIYRLSKTKSVKIRNKNQNRENLKIKNSDNILIILSDVMR